MTVTLPDDVEQLMQRQLASGRFSGPADVIAAALRLLDAHDDLRRAVAVGVDQADRGQVGPFKATDTLACVEAA